MIMRKVKYHIAIFVGLLAILTACTDTLVDTNSSQISELEKGFYPITTQMAIPAYHQEVLTRSQTYGNEGIESSADMHLFCFDKEGFFLGLAKDVTIEATPKNEIQEDGNSSLKSIKALVPNSTARIHFVANATNDFSQSASWMGMHENTLMTSFESSAGERQDQKIVYWGYVKKNTPAEMKEFLKGGQIDNVVHLIRDRAKVKVELDGAAANDIQKVIVSIYDGQEHGTIAPFNKNLTFPTTNDITAWTPDDITLSENQNTYKGSEGQMENVAYTFENRNDADKPLKVILWVTYKNGTDKRFLVLLQNQENKLYRIKRNHEYKIIVKKLNPDLGYNSFDAAVNGMPANNPWIAVEDIVPEICDGKYTLKITNGTYVLLNEGSNMPQTILFEYRGDDDITANDFEAIWTKNINFGSSDAPTISYSNGIGYVHYTLGSIENELKEGVIHLLDKKHNLSRNIHLYSITQFDYEFRFPTTMGKESTSTSTLSLKIPANYPKELLPIEIRIASNDINPQYCGVEVSNTSEVDGGAGWNNWFVKKYESEDVIGTTQEIVVKNARTNNYGTTGKFYVKANYYNGGYEKTKAKEFTFTYR